MVLRHRLRWLQHLKQNPERRRTPELARLMLRLRRRRCWRTPQSSYGRSSPLGTNHPSFSLRTHRWQASSMLITLGKSPTPLLIMIAIDSRERFGSCGRNSREGEPGWGEIMLSKDSELPLSSRTSFTSPPRPVRLQRVRLTSAYIKSNAVHRESSQS